MRPTSHGPLQSSKRTLNYVRATRVPAYVILATTSNYQATLPPSILIKHLSDIRAIVSRKSFSGEQIYDRKN